MIKEHTQIPIMSFNETYDLPDHVKSVLPLYGQQLYYAAFTRAREECGDDLGINDEIVMEENAHKAAWEAVKSEYEINEKGDWVKR